MTNTIIDASTPAALLSAFVQRLNDGDLDGLLHLYEPAAIFELQPGVVLRGHAEIRAALGQLLILQPKLSSTIVQVLEADGVALVLNAWTMTLTAADGEEQRQSGRSADLLRRQADGTWRVLVDKP